jgi:hypothetical protein
MGNTFAPEADTSLNVATKSLFVTTHEQQKLSSIFTNLLQPGQASKTVCSEYVSKVFNCNNSPNIELVFVKQLVATVSTSQQFEELIIRCTRSSTDDTIGTFWNFVLETTDLEPHNYLLTFFSLLIEMAFRDLAIDLKEVDVLSKRLATFLASLLKQRDPQFEMSHLMAKKLTFLPEINNYLSNTAKVFDSYLSLICFDGHLSESYKPFYRPIMTMDKRSEIATELDLLPLALSSDNYQGAWQRLYSTSVDGMDFNRVVYHASGYDGPTCLLIKCMGSGTVLGACVHERWRESNRFYGRYT